MRKLKTLFDCASEADKYVSKIFKGCVFTNQGKKGVWKVGDELVASGAKLPNASFWNVVYNQ